MKVYTKTGDTGTTSLLDGTRVEKSHPQIEAYASTDELNAQLGVFCSYLETHFSQKDWQDSLLNKQRDIQNHLFQVGSALAATTPKDRQRFLGSMEGICLQLESDIDKMDTSLPPLKNFILPGGSMASAQAHLLRTTTRRAERRLVALNENQLSPALVFLNRLSDYYFVLARWLNKESSREDIPWKNK